MSCAISFVTFVIVGVILDTNLSIGRDGRHHFHITVNFCGDDARDCFDEWCENHLSNKNKNIYFFQKPHTKTVYVIV